MTAPLYAGSLNRRVQILAPSPEVDEVGQSLDEWAPVGNPTWAAIKSGSGVAAIRAGGEVSTVKTAIRLRYRLDVAEGQRVRNIGTGALYAVLAVIPDDVSRKWVDLVCEVVK